MGKREANYSLGSVSDEYNGATTGTDGDTSADANSVVQGEDVAACGEE